MTYKESLDFLYSRLPMFQRVGAAALKYDLSNTIKLLERLGNPHGKLKCIHIAGTNGKGSSAHALASVLTHSGYQTALFTSPHLKSFTERIRINGVSASETFVADFVTQHLETISDINPSFFELTFGMAMSYFAQKKVDIAIVEVGLGGRLDSTNIITPELSLITSIGLDHTDLLGENIEEIAAEKAGIIKDNIPVVIGSDQPEILHVFENESKKKGAHLYEASEIDVATSSTSKHSTAVDVFKNGGLIYSNLELDISADYFKKNLPGVLKVLEVLGKKKWNITEESLRAGLQSVKETSGLKGRFQVLKELPLTIVDISHNLPGLTALFNQIETLNHNNFHLIFGVVQDKKIEEILSLLSTISANFYFTESNVPRSMKALELKKLALNYKIAGDSFSNVNEAIKRADNLADQNDLILICGSTFVVAEIDDL